MPHLDALDGTGVALTDGGALHVDLLAHSKHVRHRHSCTRGVLASGVSGHAEFLDDFTGFHTCLGKVAVQVVCK